MPEQTKHSIDRLTLVGWREWTSLPDLGIPWIKAKVDTGARSSALHAFELDTVEQEDRLYARFSIHPIQNDSDTVLRCIAPIIDQRTVTDSGGHRELRYVIESSVTLAGTSWPVEFTLTNRENMKFRMLLGRTAMRGRLLVDPSQSFLHGRPAQTQGGHIF